MIEYKTVSLANQVFETLENAILRGEYTYGEIVSEKKLAAKLGVSRTPVREAMTRLAQEKLIKDTTMGSVVLGITPKDIRDLLEVKSRIEPLIAELLTTNISGQAIDQLRDLVEQQEFYSKKGDYEKVMRLDTEFHDLMYNQSRSVVYESILSQIHHKLLKYRLASLKDEARIRTSVREHKELFNAIEARNKDKVRELLSIHVEHAYINIMKGATSGINNSGEDN